MVILALGSLGGGAALAVGGTLQRWLQPVTNPADSLEPHQAVPVGVLTALTLTVVAVGILVAVAK
ncbi:hypothetical protein PJN21_29390, partial [Mycobacterium kansasii]